MTEFKRIPPEQAQALREQGAVVVDVRDPQAFAASHISGAKHLDNHSLHDFITNADLDCPPDRCLLPRQLQPERCGLSGESGL